MIYKIYGKTGKKVSAVGFGGMQFDTRQSQPENARLLLYAYERGINFFDTAPDYCRDQSEDIFGLALEQMKKERDNFYVCSKASPTVVTTAQAARQAVAKSLKRLRTEKIDFFYVWCIRTMEHYQLAMKKNGLYEGLRQCRDQGLIDHIVISTHLRGQEIEQILNAGQFEGVLLGVNILNFPYRWPAVEAAYQMGYGVAVMNPLAGGAIARYADRLGFLADEDQTPVEAALRFCISSPQITVTLNGFTTAAHIDTAVRVAENCRPFNREKLTLIKDNLLEKMDYICTGCGYCLAECPQNIPIANYLQYYNEKLLFGRSDADMIKGLGREYQWGVLVDQKRRASDCTQCGQCETACTQQLNIRDRLMEMDQWEKAFRQGDSSEPGKNK